MDRDLRNKVVVITGAAEGIGFSIADEFLRKGAQPVIIVDINEEAGINAMDKLNSQYGDNKTKFIKGDVTTDLKEISKDIFDTYKTVDVLVNNAGISDENQLRKTIEINVIAVMEWCMEFYEHMRKDNGGKGGTIINLASIYSYIMDPLVPIYSASKCAVFGFTGSLGHWYYYNNTGVRIVAICPGFTETRLTKIGRESKEFKDILKVVLKEVTWQTPDSVGRAAAEVFEKADSGTAWEISADKLKQIVCKVD